MTNYKFIRQYDSPLYWVLLTICVGISIAFTVAAFAEPLTLAFAGLFALLSYAIYIGIFRRYNSGLMIDDTTLRWFLHYGEDDIQIVDLCRIVRVNWKHFDSEWIVLTLEDASTVKLDERFFGDGAAVLAALAAKTDGVELLDDGRPWRGAGKSGRFFRDFSG